MRIVRGSEFHFPATALKLFRIEVIKMTAFHLGMTIAYARWFTKTKDYTKYPLIGGNGINSREEALHWLNRLEKDGFKYVPCCENINNEGNCLGIPDENHKFVNGRLIAK